MNYSKSPPLKDCACTMQSIMMNEAWLMHKWNFSSKNYY